MNTFTYSPEVKPNTGITYWGLQQVVKAAANHLKLTTKQVYALPLYIDGKFSEDGLKKQFPARLWDKDEVLWLDTTTDATFTVIGFEATTTRIDLTTQPIFHTHDELTPEAEAMFKGT